MRPLFSDERVRPNQLEEAKRLKSEFLANMSHELRTPLNSIIGFAELMHDEHVGPVSAAHKEFLGDILTSARHLLHLIDDVLDLSKIDAGEEEFHPEPIDLAEVAAEVAAIAGGLAAKKNISIETEVPEETRQLTLDPGKLKQVLFNYLSNAVKFTPEGGSIRLRARLNSPNEVRIEVQDSGIGIAPEELDILFLEFRQLDQGMSKKYQGTGLGLALTKRIVEAQSGKVGVSSTLGQGSVFYAILPRDATHPADDVQRDI